MLAPYGYEISVAKDGKEAIEKIFNDNPDCILLDLLLPEKTGFDVLETLKEKKSLLRLLF